MNKSQTYRLISGSVMIALIVQVFLLQGLHHFIGHHDHGEPCNTAGVHMHDAEHGHFSCNVCVFQFAPSDVTIEELNLPDHILISDKLQFNFQELSFTQSFPQTCLRGPPSQLA